MARWATDETDPIGELAIRLAGQANECEEEHGEWTWRDIAAEAIRARPTGPATLQVPDPDVRELFERAERAWQRFFYPANDCFDTGAAADKLPCVDLEVADCLRLVLAAAGHAVQPPAKPIPYPIGHTSENVSDMQRRNDALATAFALLDSFAGDGLANVFGNGQELDAAEVCVELTAAFGMEAEPGWERRVAAILAALPLDGREDWRPIKTAPRDGTDVILFFPLEGLNHDFNPQTIIASWRKTGRGMSWIFQNRGVRGYSDCFQPTHWQPLPAPPAIRKLAGEGE